MTLHLVTATFPAPRARRYHAIAGLVIDDFANALSTDEILTLLTVWADAAERAQDRCEFALVRQYVRPAEDLCRALRLARQWQRASSPLHRMTA